MPKKTPVCLEAGGQKGRSFHGIISEGKDPDETHKVEPAVVLGEAQEGCQAESSKSTFCWCAGKARDEA